MPVRLSKVAREFNVGISTIVEFLQDKGIKISSDPNAKLSDIAKGGGNSRSTPYDDKYHVNVLFGQVNGMQVIDMLTCDLYFIKNPTEQEKQARLEQELEQQRQIEEQQRKEREEAERKARERRAKIDVFLAERVDTIYSIESANRSKYNQDKKVLSRAIASAVEHFNPQNLDLTVKDSVYIDFMGNIKHSIVISGTPEISGLENAVRKQMEQSRIAPMSIKVPGTDTTCTVTSADLYLLRYRASTESSDLKLKKTESTVSVKSGDRQFYQNNKSGINAYLSKGNGIYKIDATVKNNNGKKDTDVSINKFRNTKAMIRYSTNDQVSAIQGREQALKRAITNIIANAFNYGKNIAVALESNNNKLEITVDDDGPGIPADKREDVFKAFYRLDESRNKETGGVGLGLSIARDIITSHGGKIELTDSELGGLRVLISIPL